MLKAPMTKDTRESSLPTKTKVTVSELKLEVLEFVVAIFHEMRDYDDTKMMNIVSMCLGTIVQWNKTVPETRSNHTLKYREPLLKISCITSVTTEKNTSLQNIYRICISDWLKKLCLYAPFPKPVLMVNKNAFSTTCVLSHEGLYTHELSIGTLTSNSEYHEHSSTVQNPASLSITTTFFHDTRYIEVHVNNYLMVIQYSSISHVVCDEDEFFCSLYLYLINPTYHYDVQDTPGVRIVSMPWISADVVGRSNTVKLVLPKSVTILDVVSRLYFRCGKIQVVYTSVRKNLAHVPPLAQNVDLLEFKCTYMFNSLLMRSFMIELQYPGRRMKILVRKLRELAHDHSEILYQALIETMYMMDDGVFFDFAKVIQELFHCKKELDESSKLVKVAHYIQPVKSRYIWRVTITPTRTLLWPASVMLENRVLRKFDANYACRVSFRDDNNRKLNSANERCDDEVYRLTIRKPMTEGIVVGPRCFEFLGWSNSQIRDHGVWMYAMDSCGNTANSVRAWMGDFSGLTSVPMFMARMGQCFSQSEESVHVAFRRKVVRTDPDIVGGRNPIDNRQYTFSDGVGRISEGLLHEVCQKMDLPNVPSALQIRYAGYKGMLVLDPSLSDDLDIVFRESMKKFECSQSQHLEIVKSSGPVPVYLNRNLITILSQMGVQAGVFLKLQEDMLRGVTDILMECQPAVDYLRKQCNLPGLDYEDLSNTGICPTMEPFFRSMLLGLHRKAVENIKTKARLEIPHQYGRNMFGVIDETRTLEYGQVFVQYSTDINGLTSNREIHIGSVLVTKNPCLQKGDVRMLEAVDVPELHHILDCIVFPQKGNRPHPNEMAGSDLDGDEYTVIWYEPLFFKKNFDPSDFPVTWDKLSGKSFEVSDMIDFLCCYVQNDQTGIIGNAHLAKADELGLDHIICRTIARKFSVAVDFNKNGQLVTLDKDERATRYPDFMDKKFHADTYRSRSVLGKLFRICQSFEAEDIYNLSYSPVKVDPDLVVPGWKLYKDQAIQSRDRYNHLLETLLSTYGVVHESEAMSQTLFSIHKRLQERRDKAEVEDIVQRSIQTLWKNMKREFIEEFGVATEKGEIDFVPSTEKILQKASAWYIVTYSDPAPRFLSFPWIVASFLALIKTMQSGTPHEAYRSATTTFHKLNFLLLNLVPYNQVNPLGLQFGKLCSEICPHLDRTALELATRVLLHWANHHQLISNFRSHHQSAHRTNLKTVDSFNLVFSFLNVVKKMSPGATAVEIYLCFLRKCISLRFLNTSDKEDQWKVATSKFRTLGKKAMLTYHNIAITGELGSIGLKSRPAEETQEEQEMDPVRLPRRLVTRHRRTNYQLLKKDLQALSGVTEVRVRSLARCSALLSAIGSPEAIKRLKNAIFKENSTL